MGNYQACSQACSQASANLYRELSSRQELRDHVTFGDYSGSFCFRVHFVNQPRGFQNVYGISISFPPDAMGNRGTQNGDPELPTTIETALFQLSGELYYNSELGYDDVGRFGSADEIVDEIIRISQFVHDPNFIEDGGLFGSSRYEDQENTQRSEEPNENYEEHEYAL